MTTLRFLIAYLLGLLASSILFKRVPKNAKPMVYLVIIILFVMYISLFIRTTAHADSLPPETRIDAAPFLVECTAYCDDGITKSGKPTVPNCTIAGAEEWLGCMCVMWDEDWNFIGFYEFTDTGYGKDGDIPRGETVDIFIPDRDACIEWGRRNVYIQIIKGVG